MTAVAVSTLVDGMSGVATLPAVYFRLTAVAADPHASAETFARVVADDPGLTSRLLRLVNSPLFGAGKRIATVPEAILLVGTQQLQDLALATSVLHLFRNVPAEFVTMEGFWRHSVACGIAARLLAARRREPNIERFFVAGLLHDIGRPVLYLREPDLARQVFEFRQAHGGMLRDAERAVLGFDHTNIGLALLDAWRIPSAIQEAVAYHHMPVLNQRVLFEAAVVHVADILAHALQFGTSGEVRVPALVPRAWDAIGLPVTVVPEILGELERQFHGVVQAMLAEHQ